MKIVDPCLEDGRNCAHLINLLKSGRWDVSGKDMELIVEVKRWVASIAVSLADSLKTKAPAVATAPVKSSGFKIKKMGSIPQSPKGKKK